MPSVDNRIVRIEFDNKAFEQKIASTITSLGNLDKALEFKNAGQGLANIQAASDHVNFGGMAGAIDNINSKLGAMGAIGFSVIQSLTQSIIGFVTRVGGSLFDPIFEGGLNRAKQLEQARFMFEGLGIDVEQAMNSAKQAVLGTAYGLGEAAKVAAQFGAGGIQAGDQMTGALRAVAGAAAMTGSSFAEIGYIFTGIAGQGKVNTQDLMQFATRGVNAAAAIAKVMGTTEQAVRDMVSNGELDFQTFANAMDQAFGVHATEANKTFTGALANMKAALSRLGAAFITPQLTNFRDIFNGLTPVIDNFTAAIKPAIDTISVLTRFATNQFTEFLKGIDFSPLAASMPLITRGFLNIYEALKNVWNIGKQAFQHIFPSGFGDIVIKVALAFEQFTEKLHVSVDGMSRIRSIFEGFFSILSIGWTIVKEGVGFLLDLGKALLGIFGPGIADGMAKIGDFFTNLQDKLVKGGGIKSFFDGLEESLKKPLDALRRIKDAVGEFFDSFTKDAGDKVGDVADSVGDRFDALKDRLSAVWGPFLDAAGRIIDGLQPIAEGIIDWFKGLWDKLADGLTSQDFSNIFDALNTTLLGGIAALIAKFLKGGINFSLGPGFLNLGGTLQAVTNSLEGMQTVLKSEALLKIGEAIGILAAALLVLSTIDSESLTRALTAMSVGFGQLIGSFAALEKLSTGPTGALDFVGISAGLILLAGAMLILSVAVKILSTMDWDGLVKGLTGVTVLLGGLSLAVIPLSANSEGMIKAGFAIGEIAVAMTILAVAMKIMATMSWEEMAKGLVGVAGGLTAIVTALNLMPSDLAMVKAGFSILAISTAMVVLGGAVKIFASMDWETLARGMLGFALGLGAIVLAVNLMPKDAGSSATAILLVAGAILVMSAAINMLGDMSWENLAKGLVGVAVSLGLLVAAALVMEAGLPGAFAMVIMAGALVVLSKAIQTMGNMSWEDLAKGLIGLAVAIGLIAGASLLLTPVIPEILLLGAALLLLGAGIALVGAGAYLLAKAFETIAAAAEKLVTSLPDIGEAIGKTLPGLMKGLAEGVVEMIKVFTDAAPSIAKAVGILVTYLIDTFIKLTPKLVELMGKLLDGLIQLIYEYTEPLIAAGIHIIKSLLQGIEDNIEEIATMVVNILAKFLDGLAEGLPNLVESAVNLFGTFFTSVAEGLGELMPTLTIGVAAAFVEGFISGLEQNIGPAAEWFGGLADKVITWIGDVSTKLIQKGVDFLTGLYNGIVSAVGNVTTFFSQLPGNVISWIGDTLGTLLEKGADFLRGLLNGINSVVGEVTSFFSSLPGKVISWIGDTFGTLIGKGIDLMAGFAAGIGARFSQTVTWFTELPGHIVDFFDGALDWLVAKGEHIIQGLWNGMKRIWHQVEDWLGSVKDKVVDFITGPFDLGSPSKVMFKLGVFVMQGFHLGLKEAWDQNEIWMAKAVSNTSMLDVGDTVVEKMLNPISEVAKKLSDMPEFQPTITPVLDLTRVASDAGKIGDYIKNVNAVVPTVSFENAKVISTAQKIKAEDVSTTSPEPTSTNVNFEQNIYSPTQLSAADIYKQTRNQITIAKEELSVP